MYEILLKVAVIGLVLITIKAIFVGSSFNFYYWIKFGKIYTKWYFDEKRASFTRYLCDNWDTVWSEYYRLKNSKISNSPEGIQKDENS